MEEIVRSKKETLLGIIVLMAMAAAGFGIYQHEKGKTHRDLTRKIRELSPKGGPPETIEGLKTAISAYEKQIELNVKEGAQTGVYWKILATRYADRGMHEDALNALEKALRFNAEDPTLFYLTGVSAGVVAKSSIGFPGAPSMKESQARYFSLAESAYRRAIEIDPSYSKPRYGLGVLYVFELDRPAEAIPHLTRYLELMSSDINAMFALARAYYVTGNSRDSVELYDRIISRTKDPKIKAEAQNNKEIVLGSSYG
jgi:tetratricopeptide (TPR) repeat protein